MSEIKKQKKRKEPELERNLLQTNPTRAKKQLIWKDSKKLKQKFNRAIFLVLKHVDAQINLDLHQFLKSDPIKKLEPEAKYNSLRKPFSEHWGPHSSLDV